MTVRKHALPVDLTAWEIPTASVQVLTWEYDDVREGLLNLYQKGKERQWNATERLDWSITVDPESPANGFDFYIPIFGSDIWARISENERKRVRRHVWSWINSQFLHGEQGALVCAAKIVATVPDLDAKFYAATQVMDEARHVEVYSRYLREKIELAYPINPRLQELLNLVIADPRWDMTCLGMQVVIEGLALAASALIRNSTAEPLARMIHSLVAADEARHIAFGRFALRDFYAQLTQAERDDREEFVSEAFKLMLDQFKGEQVWERVGLDVPVCVAQAESSGALQEVRRALCSRILPSLKDIGLWGPRVQQALRAMGMSSLADAPHETGRPLREDTEIGAVVGGAFSHVANERLDEESAGKLIAFDDVAPTSALGGSSLT